MGKCLNLMAATLCLGIAQVTLAAEIKVLSAGANLNLRDAALQ